MAQLNRTGGTVTSNVTTKVNEGVVASAQNTLACMGSVDGNVPSSVDVAGASL